MDRKAIKELMRNETPIIHNNIEHKYISAIIYRKSGVGYYVQVELMDRTERCVVIVSPEAIEVKKNTLHTNDSSKA